MNLDIIKANWKQLKGKAQIKWGELTDDDLDVIEGNATELSGILQEKYGLVAVPATPDNLKAPAIIAILKL